MREIQSGFPSRRGAMVADPEYKQAGRRNPGKRQRTGLALKSTSLRYSAAEAPKSSESYTDQVISVGSWPSASGASDGAALAVNRGNRRKNGGAVDLASPQPSNQTALRSGLSRPPYSTPIGRALCRSGESVHVVDVRGGRVTLTPTASWSVHGSEDPSTWFYRVNLSGPDSTRTVTLPQTSVLHVRYAPSPDRPWAGRSPVALALDTAKAASLLETATAGELGFTQTQMLTPRRAAGDFGVAETLAPDTLSKIVSAFSEHVNVGAFVLPADVTPSRLGPEPPDSFPLLRDRLENAMYAMHGIPPASDRSTNSTGTCQCVKRFGRCSTWACSNHLGAIIAEELQREVRPRRRPRLLRASRRAISSGTSPRPRLTRESWTHTAGSRSHRGTR